MATSVKEALRQWEDENKGSEVSIGRATQIVLSLRRPPIKNLDNSLSSLTSVQFLSLSSNVIENIAGLERLSNLRTLSLARNNIKDLSGIEGVAGTLEQLWLSYNLIEKLRALKQMKKLRVLNIGYNAIKDWKELENLSGLPELQEMVLFGNPISEGIDQNKYMNRISTILPNIQNVDGLPVIRGAEDNYAETTEAEEM